MHLKRWLTGIIAVPILIWLIGPEYWWDWLGVYAPPRWAFYTLVYLASLAALMEFYKITAPELPRSLQICIHTLALMVFYLFYKGNLFLVLGVFPFFAFFPALFFMLTFGRSTNGVPGDLGSVVMGPVYITFPLALLLWIDRAPSGNLWILFMLAVVFASDTGAFYFGKLFGSHKMYKAVSPGKTWEGAAGGLVSSVIASFVFSRLVHLNHSDLSIVILAVCLSLAEQCGDLAESMLKRSHGVKDSGGILPGHGGMLDRIDGLLFAVPIIYGFLWFSIK